jgi:hypothetical protein
VNIITTPPAQLHTKYGRKFLPTSSSPIQNSVCSPLQPRIRPSGYPQMIRISAKNSDGEVFQRLAAEGHIETPCCSEMR